MTSSKRQQPKDQWPPKLKRWKQLIWTWAKELHQISLIQWESKVKMLERKTTPEPKSPLSRKWSTLYIFWRLSSSIFTFSGTFQLWEICSCMLVLFATEHFKNIITARISMITHSYKYFTSCFVATCSWPLSRSSMVSPSIEFLPQWCSTTTTQ